MSISSFSFIHVTDTHLREDLDVVSPFIEGVNRQRYHHLPDFIVFGGDNVDGSRHEGGKRMGVTAMRGDLLGK